MSARLKSLLGVTTGLGGAIARKRVGGRTGIGSLLGGRATVWRLAAVHWRKSRHWRRDNWPWRCWHAEEGWRDI